MNQMIITRSVLEEIRQTIGNRPAECGGILGADEYGTITHYYFDETGCSTPDSYEPDVNAINSVLITDWLPNGIHLAGVIHSHANGNATPSCGDIHYGMRILQALDGLERLYLPIATGLKEDMALNVFAVETDQTLGTVCRKLDWTTKATL